MGIKNNWQATLLPVEEVPRINGTATAFGSIHLIEESILVTDTDPSTNLTDVHDERSLRFRLLAAGDNFTEAHLHVGSRCVAGPIVVPLFSSANGTSLPAGGILAQGVLTKGDLTGPLADFNIYDLVQEIKAGNVYANVHTKRFPAGEARGQIKALQEDTEITSDLLNSTLCKGNYNKFLGVVAANATGIVPSEDHDTFGPDFDVDLQESLLAGEGPFTVFAPPDDTWDVLVTPEKINQTDRFLGRHIVPGVYTFSDFLGKVIVIQTISGVNLTIDGVQRPSNTSLLLKAAHQPRVTVNGARIIEPDAVIANNGVLHGTANPLTPLCLPARNSATTPATSGSPSAQRRLRRIRQV